MDTAVMVEQVDDLSQAFSYLRNMPVFGGVSEDALGLLLDGADRVSVKPGKYFFREGDPGEAMFVLLHGRASVTREIEGRPRSLGRVSAGDCFGEMALIDLYPRSATVRAIEECEALSISNGLLYQLYNVEPEPYTIIVTNLARELSRRLRISDERLCRVLGQTAVPKRRRGDAGVVPLV